MEVMDYEAWELCSQIRSAIDCLQRYVQDEDSEPSMNTIYYALEGIRLKTELIEAIASQPLEERLKASDIKQLAMKLKLSEEQIYTMIYQEDEQNERETA